MLSVTSTMCDAACYWLWSQKRVRAVKKKRNCLRTTTVCRSGSSESLPAGSTCCSRSTHTSYTTCHRNIAGFRHLDTELCCEQTELIWAAHPLWPLTSSYLAAVWIDRPAGCSWTVSRPTPAPPPSLNQISLLLQIKLKPPAADQPTESSVTWQDQIWVIISLQTITHGNKGQTSNAETFSRRKMTMFHQRFSCFYWINWVTAEKQQWTKNLKWIWNKLLTVDPERNSTRSLETRF